MGSSSTSACGRVTSDRAMSTRLASPVDISPSSFPAQMRGVHVGERGNRRVAHRRGHRLTAKESLRGEESRDHGVFPVDLSGAVAGDETLVEIGGHDAELRAKLEDVPSRTAKHLHGRRLTVLRRQRVGVERQQVDQGGLAGPVGTEDRGVLAGPNRQRDRIEHRRAAAHHGRVRELQDGKAGERITVAVYTSVVDNELRRDEGRVGQAYGLGGPD